MRSFVAGWRGDPSLSIQDESAKILGSGGGVAQAAPWLFEGEDLALVCNSDVLAAPDLGALISAHRRSGALCTLVVMPHPEAGRKFTGLRVAGERVTGFEKTGAGLLHFPGYYVISRGVIDRLPPAGGDFSIVESLWKPLAAEGGLGAFRYEGPYFDLGTMADLAVAEDFLAAGGRLY
jgi:mannose-1-phosphate guanylyltransferase